MSHPVHRSPWADEATGDPAYPSAEPQAVPQYDPLEEPYLAGSTPTAFDAVFWLYVTIAVVVGYGLYQMALTYYYRYQEKQEMLERRRRAGIPDEDKRPFNIAYTAAALARREREEMRRKREEEEAAKANQNQESDWQRLGRTLGVAHDRPFVPRAGFLQQPQTLHHRFPHLAQERPPQQHYQPPFPVGSSGSSLEFPRSNPQLALQTRNTFVPPQAPIDSPTITSSASPPRPIPPVWQDRYAPPAVKAANQARRISANLPTALGRRSRKELILDDTSETDSATHSRSRVRTNAWGKDTAIDGDDEAKWIGGHQPKPNGILTNRTRKRDDDPEEEEEEDDGRAKSKRKVETDELTVPGGLPASGIVGAGKRKEREEDSAPDAPRTTKLKKRVRVLSYHESQEPQDKEMVTAEEQSPSSSAKPARKTGEEWVVDGVKHKMSDNGVELMEAFVKEQKSVLKTSNRFSPNKTLVASITKRWMTPEAYARAEKAGTLTREYSEEMLVAELKEPSRASSNEASDWASIVGQTPLKTGGLKTGLSSDRTIPPFSSLPQATKLPIEQSRLLHMASPRAKNVPYGKGATNRKGHASKWEKKKAEEQALETIRAARRAANAEKAAAIAKSSSGPATITISVTQPGEPAKTGPVFAFKPPAPSPSLPAATTPSTTLDAPKPVFSFGTAAATASQPAAPTVAPAVARKTVTFKEDDPKPATAEVPKPTPVQEAKAQEPTKPVFSFAPAPSQPAVAAPPTNGPSMPSTEKPAALPLFGGFKPAEPVKPASTLTAFSFGSTAGSSKPTETKSLFGAASSSGDAPPKPLFGVPTSTPSTTPIFGSGASTTAEATKPPLTQTPTEVGPVPSAAPPAGSALFGAAPSLATTSAAPKPVFSFGTGLGKAAAPTPSTLTPTTVNPPSTAAFGGPPVAASNTPAVTGFSFGGTGGFGSKATPAPAAFSFGSSTALTPSTSTAAAPAPTFGGFGTSTSNTPTATTPAAVTENKPATTGFSIFGAAGKAAEQPKQEAQKPITFGASPAPVFSGFGGAASAVPTPTSATFGSSGPKPFTFGASSATPAFGAAAGGAANGSSTAPSSPFAFGAPATDPSAGATLSATDANQTPTTPVFNLGTPPPQNRVSKPLPNRARR